MAEREPEAHVYAPELETLASDVLRIADRAGLKIATAESCTGGAFSALLTDVEGLSHVFERGFAVYCDAAKRECLGLSPELLQRHGPVSREAAAAMAHGAIERSDADMAVSITGFAGPAGPRDEVGLVFIGCAHRTGAVHVVECHYGDTGRARVRMKAMEEALELLRREMENRSQWPRQRDATGSATTG